MASVDSWLLASVWFQGIYLLDLVSPVYLEKSKRLIYY